jgi:hypothetical protein
MCSMCSLRPIEPRSILGFTTNSYFSTLHKLGLAVIKALQRTSRKARGRKSKRVNIVSRGGAMIMLKAVGIDPLPNYRREPDARWDAYLYVRCRM